MEILHYFINTCKLTIFLSSLVDPVPPPWQNQGPGFAPPPPPGFSPYGPPMPPPSDGHWVSFSSMNCFYLWDDYCEFRLYKPSAQSVELPEKWIH